MSNYYSVGSISTEIGVSDKTIYARAKKLGIDVQKIGEAEKRELLDSLNEYISFKDTTKAVIDKQKQVKAENVESILDQSGSTIENRLIDLKREYDAVNVALIEIEEIIQDTGRIAMNPNGSTNISSAMKTKLELLKQFVSLQTKIQDLEDKMRFSITNTIDESAIED